MSQEPNGSTRIEALFKLAFKLSEQATDQTDWNEASQFASALEVSHAMKLDMCWTMLDLQDQRSVHAVSHLAGLFFLYHVAVKPPLFQKLVNIGTSTYASLQVDLGDIIACVELGKFEGPSYRLHSKTI